LDIDIGIKADHLPSEYSQVVQQNQNGNDPQDCQNRVEDKFQYVLPKKTDNDEDCNENNDCCKYPYVSGKL
jgi:hypothetical protein